MPLSLGCIVSTANCSISPRPILVGSAQRVTTVACGGFHTAVITARGDLYTFGRGDSGQLGHGELNAQLFPLHVKAIPQKVSKIACGVNHTICTTGQSSKSSTSLPCFIHAPQ